MAVDLRKNSKTYGKHFGITLSEENKKIEQLCLSIHVSPFIFFLTVYHLLLCQVYGRRDTIVGVPVSLRRALKYREAIGNFVNLLPIKMESKNEKEKF